MQVQVTYSIVDNRPGMTITEEFDDVVEMTPSDYNSLRVNSDINCSSFSFPHNSINRTIQDVDTMNSASKKEFCTFIHNQQKEQLKEEAKAKKQGLTLEQYKANKVKIAIIKQLKKENQQLKSTIQSNKIKIAELKKEMI